jgi:hypothetical protein
MDYKWHRTDRPGSSGLFVLNQQDSGKIHDNPHLRLDAGNIQGNSSAPKY